MTNVYFVRGLAWGWILIWVFCPGLVYSQSNEDIFSWTMKQMNIEHSISPPEIQWVSSAELKQIFTKHSRKAYLQWEKEYGVDQAQEIMRSVLDEILGLFAIETDIVYVGNFMEPCRRQAILAHELVHYLQQVTQGTITGYGEETEKLMWMREFEAHKIENIFMQQFCASESESMLVSASGR